MGIHMITIVIWQSARLTELLDILGDGNFLDMLLKFSINMVLYCLYSRLCVCS